MPRMSQVIAVEGDSAFGFSGMELEAACRHKLGNLTVLVVNNNGIYQGLDELDEEPEWCAASRCVCVCVCVCVCRPAHLTCSVCGQVSSHGVVALRTV